MNSGAVWGTPKSLPISKLSRRDELDTIQVEDGHVLVNRFGLALARRIASFSFFVHSYTNRHWKRLYYEYFTKLVEPGQKFYSTRTLI